MLAIENAVGELRALPLLTRLGLAVLVIGGLLDVAAHLGATGAGDHHGHEFSSAEVEAHLVVFAGMVLVLLGVVIDGVRRARPGRPAGNTTKGGT